MRSCLLVLIVFLVASCGKLRQEEWPAFIADYTGFSSEQQEQLKAFALQLNTQSQITLIKSEGGEEGYPLFLELVDPPANEPQRAGYAISGPDRCTIQLSRFLFQPQKEDYRKSVFFHEVAHCAGLGHTNEKADLMFPTTSKWSSYDASHLTSFFNRLVSATFK